MVNGMTARSPLPATLLPFDWRVVSASGKETPTAYWSLVWGLLAEQDKRLREDGIEPRDRFDERGTVWTASVDLDLTYPSDFAWHGGERFVPSRSVGAPATASSEARLMPGIPLRLEDAIPDRYYEGMGTNYWAFDPADATDLGVPWIHSALEGRWGGSAVLGDYLIVPIDHPIVGDAERADRLVRDLQEITRAFRVTAGLPAEGTLARR